MSASTRRAALGAILAAPLASVPATAALERTEYRTRLLIAYAEDRASRPIGIRARNGSIDEKAADLVQQRCWAIAKEVTALPPPNTIEGLALTALAAAILSEADDRDDPTVIAAAGLTRAVLAFTGTPLPIGFAGFGDEPDHRERDEAVHNAAGSLPAWAVEEAAKQRRV
ncbi:hypothetical protein MKK65_29635 [Methylobacterium sp. J-001]|jgi:hypothetical protein|uniref:hypothetical protein n=1 Tax=Methylobacterium sp. J-001 TaxID=2836609 RepID=UPI001FB8E3B4|nr:hypothetical protein [Methylobacterium sp. J-001]MCJ2120670.1 hypothetical protein [Methylobacterium sp. J-001]